MCYYYDENIRKLTLFDDDYMTAFFDKDIPSTELLLHVILNDASLTVDSVKVQEVLKNLRGHSLTLDIKARDVRGKAYDIEVQQADSGADPRRARYHSSILDSYQLPAGNDFKELKDTYVIFITRNDVLRGNQPIYHVERGIREKDGESFADGSHIIYVNGEWAGQDPIGWLTHDFKCENPDEMYYTELADRSRMLKCTKKGEQTMSWWGDELRTEEKRKTAINLHNMGMDVNFIAKAVNATVEQVQQWLSAAPIPAKS